MGLKYKNEITGRLLDAAKPQKDDYFASAGKRLIAVCDNGENLYETAWWGKIVDALRDLMDSNRTYPDKDGFDHDCVRCDEMADHDCDHKYPGETGTCCVCAGHNCEEARKERLIHPELIRP